MDALLLGQVPPSTFVASKIKTLALKFIELSEYLDALILRLAVLTELESFDIFG